MNDLTVIIPVYNGETYLKECLDSIVNQTLGIENFEVIIVNDNSTDNSLGIINEYASQYPNFTVISNESNLGAGQSRNIAVNKVNTPYLTFVDCDDFISKNAFKDSLSKIKENNAELLIYNWQTYTGSDYVEPINIHQQNTDENILLDGIEDNPKLVFSTSSWNKIYHKNLYKYLKFSDATYDDNVAVVSAIINSNKIFLFKDATYFYRKNLSSTTENITLNHAYDLADSILELYQLNNPNIILLIINFINDILFWVYTYDWDIESEISVVEKLSCLNISSGDLDKFEKLFDKDIYRQDILNISEFDPETFLAKFKYFNRLNKVKSNASLYIDVGDGFNEEDKLSIGYVPKKNNILTFDLSNFNKIYNVRFDPLEGDFIKAKVNNLNIIDANCDNSINDDYQIFLNLDPNYLLDFKINEKLTIDFDLIFLTKDDISNLLINKNNIITETKQKNKKSRFNFLK